MTAGGLCSQTRIDGITENLTGHEISLTHSGHGLTNAWCERPSERVVSGQPNDWRVGDNFFGTRVQLIYAVLGGNKVRFDAEIKFVHGVPGTTSTDCRFEKRAAHNRRHSQDNRFSCDAKLTPPGKGHVTVRFVVSRRLSAAARERESQEPSEQEHRLIRDLP